MKLLKDFINNLNNILSSPTETIKFVIGAIALYCITFTLLSSIVIFIQILINIF